MELQVETPERWLEIVLDDFDSFLIDHADCERKASSLAMSLAVRFADKEVVVDPLLSLAQEELRHFQEVYELMKPRGLRLGANKKDPYVKELVKLIRHSEDHFFMDKMLVSGVIEARGHERFTLLADALKPGQLKDYYSKFAAEEAGHAKIFTRILRHYFREEEIVERAQFIYASEAEIIKSSRLEARVH